MMNHPCRVVVHTAHGQMLISLHEGACLLVDDAVQASDRVEFPLTRLLCHDALMSPFHAVIAFIGSGDCHPFGALEEVLLSVVSQVLVVAHLHAPRAPDEPAEQSLVLTVRGVFRGIFILLDPLLSVGRDAIGRV